MPDPVREATSIVANLLTYYSFEPGELSPSELSDRWLSTYSADWVRLALIEAIYQGRYKPFSVDQLLAFWQRRGQPLYHFNHEFEQLVCSNFPQRLQMLPPQPRTVTRARKQKPSLVPEWLKRGPMLPQTQPAMVPASPADPILPIEEDPLAALPQTSPQDLESPEETIPDPWVDSPFPKANLDQPDANPQSNTADSQPTKESEPIPPQLDSIIEPDARESSVESVEIIPEQAVPASRNPSPARFLIQEFIPASASSGVYSKLTALAKGQSDPVASAEQR